MGVSGCGKTTFGKELADHLLLPYFDGDDFHPASNVMKMQKGNSLTDEDRSPWLKILSVRINEWSQNGGAVLSCSALKTQYREILQQQKGTTLLVYLKADKSLIFKRFKQRKNHFMPEDLIDSQFNDLEEPEDAIILDASLPVKRNIAILLKSIRRKDQSF